MLKHGAINDLWREFRALPEVFVAKKTVVTDILKLSGAKVLPRKLLAALARNYLSHYRKPEFVTMYQGRLQRLQNYPLSSLNALLQQYFSGPTLIKSLLRYEDRNSMRFSIESRTPFADDVKLIELLFRIPAVYKIHNGWSKYPLREAMNDIMPPAILARKDKIGFAVPEKMWLRILRQKVEGYFTDTLSTYIDVQRLLLDWDRLINHWPEHKDTREIWKYVNFALWAKVYQLL
jgi:asparagine synthase (glutamine-hydrolysing)